MSEKHVCPNCKKEFNDGRGVHRHIEFCDGVDRAPYIERYKSIRENIPEKYHEVYDDLSGSGHTPRSIFAAICYIEWNETLEETSEICDTSIPTIRDKVEKLVDTGVVDLEDVREGKSKNEYQVFGHGRNEDGQITHTDS